MRLLAAALSLVVVGPALAAEPTPLFNGADLTGWDVYSEGAAAEDAWTVRDGLLVCTGAGRGYAITRRAYADYVLRLEWRWPDGDVGGRANSGVMLHAVGPDQIWPKSFEAQLKTGSAGDFASFVDARSDDEIVSRNPNGKSTGRLMRLVKDAEKPVGEWNRYEITARGDELVLVINGVEVNRLSGVAPSGGCIALQGEGYAVEFRNLSIEPLPPAKDLNAPMPDRATLER